jgi:hypothetical protein
LDHWTFTCHAAAVRKAVLGDNSGAGWEPVD